MLVPATLPALFAWVPSGVYQCDSSTRSQTSQQSPAAHTPSTTCCRSSGTSPPCSPSGSPAARARSTRGRTPIASATASAWCSTPLTQAALITPSRTSRPDTSTPVTTSTPSSSSPRRTSAPIARVERVRHRLVAAGHQRRAHAALGERLGRLHADEAAADHQHPLRCPAVGGVQQAAPGGAVVQRLHRQHAGDAARPVRHDRLGAGADHQLVEADPLGAARCRRRRRARASRSMLGDGAAEPQVDAVGPVLVRGARDQRVGARRRPRRPSTGCRTGCTTCAAVDSKAITSSSGRAWPPPAGPGWPRSSRRRRPRSPPVVSSCTRR